MLFSPAYLALSNTAKVAFAYLLADQNGLKATLRLTYAQAKKLRLADPHTLAECFRQLRELGFITLARPGGLENQAAEYVESQGWRKVTSEQADQWLEVQRQERAARREAKQKATVENHTCQLRKTTLGAG